MEGTQEPILPLLQAVTTWQTPCPLKGDVEGTSDVLLAFKGHRRQELMWSKHTGSLSHLFIPLSFWARISGQLSENREVDFLELDDLKVPSTLTIL